MFTSKTVSEFIPTYMDPSIKFMISPFMHYCNLATLNAQNYDLDEKVHLVLLKCTSIYKLPKSSGK